MTKLELIKKKLIADKDIVEVLEEELKQEINKDNKTLDIYKFIKSFFEKIKCKCRPKIQLIDNVKKASIKHNTYNHLSLVK